jgi:hypothetical protein
MSEHTTQPGFDNPQAANYGCPELGPNYGRARGTDESWDAAHVLAPGERETTLCGKSTSEVFQAYSLDSGYKPSSGDGCWTCLSESNRWAKVSA